jgi:16S rRNA (guanine1516-N2)-methyltransferase
VTASVGSANAEVAALTGIAPHANPDFLLEFAQARLQLRDLRPGAPGPLWVDFLAPEHAHRHNAGKGLLLARACGVKRGKPLPRVVDATAGLGRDSWALAALGCTVSAFERDPIAHALLADGLKRAAGHEPASRITLAQTDAIGALRGIEADVIYLDPMFPDTGNTALPGKEMQYFQALLDQPFDEHALFAAALASGARRIVVKRPRLAPAIDPSRNIDVDFPGKSVRFDVYLT